jgi:hypothetical protein
MVVELTIGEILDKKNITESSKKLYLSNFKRLNDGEPVKGFKFILDIDKIKNKIERFKPNTQRNYIISITSLLHDLKNINEKKYGKIYNEYYKLLLDLNSDLKDATAKTPSEKENWLSQEEIKNIYNQNLSILNEIKGKRNITEQQYNKLLDLVILSLYTLQPPRRNIDYMKMFIVKKYDKDANGETDNFLDLFNKQFIYNNYKTAGTYKTQKVNINDDLFNIIKTFLKYKNQPLIKVEPKTPFLTDYEGEPFIQINSLTRKLNAIFNQKIGSSMLRKLYLTDKYKDVINDLKQDATDMGTSSETIQNNYVKKD